MLNLFIINSLDTFNIIYLWTILNKKNNNIFKLLSSMIIISILGTVIHQMQSSFIIGYIIFITVLKIIYKIDLKDIILRFFLVLLIDMSLELILRIFVNRLFYNDMFVAIITELIILVSIIIFSNTKLSKNFTFENIDNNILIYFVSTCSIYAIGFKFTWDYDKEVILNNLPIVGIIFSMLVISQLLIYLYIIKKMKENEKLKVSNEYTSVIDEIVQEIKQRQHDFVNYKNTIKGLVEVVAEKDIKKVINNYMKDEDIYDNKINELIYIENVVIRSIIYRHMCKAKECNINFQYEIENNVLDNILSYNNISNVLNNLLNNAFDEVMKDECINKNIKIKIFIKNKTSHLIVTNQVVNPSNIDLNEMFTRGYSTKESTCIRGYGLYNVQQIINSHKGYIKMKIECELITINIYFNNSLG